jgi:O-antigen biosynthesis protein
MADLNHNYRRELDPDGHDSLAKIARLIAPGSHVLDLGCGPGVLGEYLTRERGCVVDGVEVNPEAASLAQRSYRKVVVEDLESYDFESLGDATYDYIVCADVLEHLHDPTVVARRLSDRLAKNGRILASIPNLAHAGLIAGLMNGEFRCRRTHGRFFTRRSLVEWLSELGLSVVALDTVRVELADSEFARERMEGFAPAVLRQLLSSEDALTHQFIVQAAPASLELPAAEAAKPIPAALTFLVQLYYRTVEPDFDEARSVVVRARMGVDPQRLRFALPPLERGPLTLRLDLADRPGFLRLHGLAVFDAQGGCAWRCDTSRGQLEQLPSHEIAFVDDATRGQLLVSLGDNPRLELALPPDPRLLAGGGFVEVDLAWPMSSDAVAVTEQLGRSSLKATLAHLDDQRNRLLRELTALRLEQRRILVERDQFERDRALLEKQLAGETQPVGTKATDAELQSAQEEIEALKTSLKQINESLTFRLGRPVFAVVNRLRAARKSTP